MYIWAGKSKNMFTTKARLAVWYGITTKTLNARLREMEMNQAYRPRFGFTAEELAKVFSHLGKPTITARMTADERQFLAALNKENK